MTPKGSRVSASGKLFLAIFTIVPLIFVVVGAGMAWNQHRKITTYQPVPATVFGKDIERHTSQSSKGGTTTTYKPIVKYRYEVGGKIYEGRQVTPTDEKAGGGWAYRIISRYDAGQTTEAFVNPDNPADAFLYRHYSFMPYLIILFPMLFFAAGAYATMTIFTAHAIAEPERGLDGWYQLRPTTNIAQRRRTSSIVGAMWQLVGIAVWGHYFRLADQPFEKSALIVTPIYVALGCVPLAMALYYTVLLRKIGDACVRLNVPRVVLGDEITVRAEQMARQDLQIQELSIGLVCEQTTETRSGGKMQISKSRRFEDRLPVVGADMTRSGLELNATATFRVPTDQPASTPHTAKGYPRYEWRIEVVTRIANSPDYRAKFPIFVQPA
jgi:hypothetical protein